LHWELSEASFRNFILDPTRAALTIDNYNEGLLMKWATIKNWDFHCKLRWKALYVFHYTLEIDVNLKDVILDSGISIVSDRKTGSSLS